MKRSSRFNDTERREAIEALFVTLLQPVNDGRDVVITTRKIIRNYIDSGYSADDDIISNLIGIDSETDDLNIDRLNDREASAIFEIYAKPFEQSRQQIARFISSSV